jgi:hypothetical protein
MTDTTHDDLVKEIASGALGIDWRDTETAARRVAKHAAARIEELEAKLATCEKYRDAYAECDRIGAQAVCDLEAKLAMAVEAGHALNDALREKERGKYLTTAQVLAAEKARATLAAITETPHD